MAHTIQQLSIFLENKLGSLNETMAILSKADIKIVAATVADTTEYGILRLITTDNEKAYQELKAANKHCNKTEVFALSCQGTTSSFYDNIKNFAADGVIIEYMYCFSANDKSFLIMRANDNEKAQEVIEKHNIKIFDNETLIK